MMQQQALDQVLKRLNGLDNDPEKRANIIKYIENEEAIAVFAYGSLMWNPITYVSHTIRGCTLHGYAKGFFCHDFIYRGTKECKGLTMGLKAGENCFTKGDLLISNIDQVIPFLEAFIERETPISIDGVTMDIYTYDFLPVALLGEQSTKQALTCVVNRHSRFYEPMELSIEEQAEIIGRSYGMNGTNYQYLQKVTDEYRKLGLVDTKTEEMEQLCAAVSRYRQRLAEDDRQWLEMFDQLATKGERQNHINLRRTNYIPIQPAA